MNARLAESIKVLKESGVLDNLSKEKNEKLVEIYLCIDIMYAMRAYITIISSSVK